MKVLATSQQVLMLLCIVPIDDPIKKWKWKQFAYIVLRLTVLGILMSQIAASTAFILKYLSVDLERSLYAVFQNQCFIRLLLRLFCDKNFQHFSLDCLAFTTSVMYLSLFTEFTKYIFVEKCFTITFLLSTFFFLSFEMQTVKKIRINF